MKNMKNENPVFIFVETGFFLRWKTKDNFIPDFPHI